MCTSSYVITLFITNIISFFLLPYIERLREYFWPMPYLFCCSVVTTSTLVHKDLVLSKGNFICWRCKSLCSVPAGSRGTGNESPCSTSRQTDNECVLYLHIAMCTYI